MICTQPLSAGPSTPRVSLARSYSAPAHSCASSYAFAGDNTRDAIFPFPGPAPTLRQRELYLRALEQEREEILAAAYASRRRNSSPSSSSNSKPSQSASSSPFSEAYTQQSYNYDYDADDSDSEEDEDERATRSGRGCRNSPTFRETVRQRQARLEFLRRQEFARRIAHRGLEGDSHASAYAIKRLPPPRTIRPIERVNAAIKIQRAWRVHSAVKGLQDLSRRAIVSRGRFLSEMKEEGNYDEAWRRHAETMHELLRELGERTGVLSSNANANAGTRTGKSQNMHPRVRVAARAAMESLREELAFLDRAQVSRHYALSSASPVSSDSSLSSIKTSEEDEFGELDSDSEYDSDDDEYSSYIYTPPQLVKTELYVVDEEDEEAEEYDDERIAEPQQQSQQFDGSKSDPELHYWEPRHQRGRHTPLSSPIPANLPGLIRSPVSRLPSLPSIPEEDEEF